MTAASPYRHYLLGAFLVAVAACGAASTSNPPARVPADAPPAGTQAAAWRVRFTQTGGFAGMNRELQLTSGGELTALDMRSKRETKQRLAEADAARVLGLLRQAPATGEAGPSLSRCNDCLEYTVDATLDGKAVAGRVIDTELAASAWRPLVEALRTLLNTALSQP